MKLKILHLEDNADDVELVRRSLNRQGLECDVHAVSSGPEYVSALDAKQFDVILSDSGLPGYDGRAALAAAHERCPGVPFIVVSGSPQPPTPAQKASSPAGATAHVAKANMKQLGAVIQHALQHVEPVSSDRNPGSHAIALKHLVSVVQRLTLARNRETVMAIVRRAVRDLTGADGATFVLRDGDQCHYADEDAVMPLWKGRRFEMQGCISGWSMLNRQTAVIENVYEDARIPQGVYRATFVKSLVMTPIRSAAPIGALGAYWARQHKATSEEVELLQALADSTSIAMESVDVIASLEARLNERTQLNERSRAELEVANRELEAFSVSVAHDLRSPLIAIEGFRQIMLESCAHTYDEENREYLARIGSAVTRMHRVIEDLLNLSKVSLQPLVPEHLDLSAMARALTGSLDAESAQRQIEFVIADGLTAVGDRNLMRTALENLLSNARKFTSRRRAARIELGTCPTGGGGIAMFVRDNGAGFDSRYADKLYKPFNRLHTQAEFPGRGIGLAIVQRIMQRHGGSLWAEAQVDRGATFYFTIPTPAAPRRG